VTQTTEQRYRPMLTRSSLLNFADSDANEVAGIALSFTGPTPPPYPPYSPPYWASERASQGKRVPISAIDSSGPVSLPPLDSVPSKPLVISTARKIQSRKLPAGNVCSMSGVLIDRPFSQVQASRPNRELVNPFPPLPFRWGRDFYPAPSISRAACQPSSRCKARAACLGRTAWTKKAELQSSACCDGIVNSDVIAQLNWQSTHQEQTMEARCFMATHAYAVRADRQEHRKHTR
jgi:hypothetical protein